MQTTSFELSKKIEKLGIIKPFTYVWFIYKNKSNFGIIDGYNEFIFDLDLNPEHVIPVERVQYFSAYTLDEILEMLPRIIISENDPKIIYKFSLEFYEDEYFIGYENANLLERSVCLAEFYHENPAEAAGQLLVWCVENGYVEAGKNNE